MATDFDSAYNSFLAQMGQDTTSKKQGAKDFDPEAYVQSLGYKPPETGLVKGTISALGRGVGGAVKQFGQALEYDQDRNPDLVNKAGSYISKGGDYLSNLIAKPVAEPDSRKEAFFGAMESVVPSLAYSIPAYVGGALGSLALPGVGTAIGATGGAALTLPIMQQAAAQDAYETISKLRPDIPEEQKRQMAEKSGLWEAGPEAATQVAGSLIMNASPQGRAVKTVADVAKSLFKPGLKTLAKNIALDAPVEMAGEFATGVGQANVLKEGGVLPQVDLIKEGLKGAESAAYMTPFVGLLGTGVNRIKGHLLEKSVTKAIPTLENGEHDPSGLNLRKQALGMMDEQLVNTLDPEAYAHWQKLAEEAISNPSKGFDIFGSLEPKTASTGIVDTSSEHDLLDTPAESLGEEVLPETEPIVDLNASDIVSQQALPVGKDLRLEYNPQEEQVTKVPNEVLSPEVASYIPTEDLSLIEDAEVVVPQQASTTQDVVQTIIPPVEGKAKNLAREAKQKKLEATIDKVRKVPMPLKEATETIKEIHSKYAPNTFDEAELQTAFEGVEAYPNAILNKVDSAGKPIADSDVLNYVKAVVSIASKSKGVTPVAKKQQTARKFNAQEFNRTYSNLVASSEKKSLLGSAFEAIQQAQEAGEIVPKEFISTVQTKMQEQIKPTKQTGAIKNVKENKGQQISSKERRGEEPKPAKSEQGSSTEKIESSRDVQSNERQAEATSTTNEKEVTKLKTELEELNKQIKEESDKEEKANLEEDARLLRKKIKDLGGRTRAKEVSKEVNIDTKTKERNKELSDFIEQGKTPSEILDYISKNSNIPFHKEIASYLKNKINKDIAVFTDNELEVDGKSVYGLYDDSEVDGVPLTTIALNYDLHQESNEDLASTLLHEFIHDATNYKLGTKAGKVLSNRLNSFKREVRQELKKQGVNPEDYYGLRESSHIDEMLSEVFSNKSFQDVLEGITLKEPKGSIRTLFDKLVDIVRSILGLDIKSNTALKELITLGVGVIEQDSITVESTTKAKHVEQAAKKQSAEAYYGMTKSVETLKEAFQNFGKDQDKMVELFLKNSSGQFRDRFPQVEKFLKNTLRMPFWIAEKMLAKDPQAGKYVARIVKASENKTENYNKTFERFMSEQGSTKSFADIRKTVEDLTLEEKIAFDRINILGDMQEKEWTSIGEVPKSDYLKDLNAKVFGVYRDLRDFSDKVYLQLQDEILESAVVKYEKKIANQLKELIKASENAEEYTPAFIEGKIKSILAMSNTEDTDLVKDILDDILETQKTINKIKNSIGQKSGYMPRIRKQGQYKLTMYEETKDGEDKRVYMNIFPNNAFRQREKELLEKDPKEIMGTAYNPDATYYFKEEYLTKTEMSNLNVSVMASDLHLQQALEKAAEKKDLSKREIQKIKKLVSQRSAEVLLGDSAGRHKIGRVEDYIVGFKQDPMAAFEEMINNMSLSIAKTRYVQEQMDNFNTLKKISPEASEFAFDYIKTTLTAKTTADALSAKARYLTTVWFMAANLGAAMINLTQNITMGVPELSRYTTNKNAITKLGKYMMLVLPEGVKHQASRKEQRIAPVSKELPKQLQEALERYRLSGLNFDTQTFLAAGANEDLSGDALWNSFRKVADTLLKPFKAVEAANREAALLAAFDVFADLDNISLTENMTDEQFSELYDKSVKFVDTVHFMGAGNLPINLQKSAFTRTLLAMQSYGINYLNFLYNRLSSGEKDQFISAAKSIGMLGIMGGAAGAIPGGDEMNKLLKMMLGRDFKLEAEKKLKSSTSEEFSNFLVYGAPTLFGVNISNNVNVRLPVVSSLIGGQDLGVSMAGAPGALATKFYKMMQFASDGDYGRALGAGSPEAFARVIRAYNEYDKGFMSQKGAPAYFAGKKLKATEGEAILKAVTGFKTVGAAKIAEVRFAEYELKEYWQDKKTKAVNKYIAGDKEALTTFNDKLKDSDQARSIINPIKMRDILRAKNKKPDKKTSEFEKEYT